ncbi:MAG: hypothetical protein NTX64_10295 [Elusimicrobia bacterium]|nr:hypothetical protein [Elusimicrobiota bacterium]
MRAKETWKPAFSWQGSNSVSSGATRRYHLLSVLPIFAHASSAADQSFVSNPLAAPKRYAFRSASSFSCAAAAARSSRATCAILSR